MQAKPDDTTRATRGNDAPEFGTSRRGFLVAMLMCGAVKPEDVTRRIIDELRAEAGK